MSDNTLNRFRASVRAFTLVELLVVIAVVALLVCLRLPAFARVRGQTTRTQCAANLKQFTLATEIYGGENNNQLPQASGNYWPFDMPYSTSVTLGNYGAQRQQMYCPANPSQNVNGLWNYAVPSFRVIGYALTFGPSTVDSDDWNSTLSAHTITLAGNDSSLGAPGAVYRVNPSTRVLLADMVLSLMNQRLPGFAGEYQWINIPGGYTAPGWMGHRTSHLYSTSTISPNNLYASPTPAGGNLGMLDGHVEWRSFTNMTCHTTDEGGDSPPSFWW
jgi:prepilin-type N-terminal cleavage/methylation domain-containing protein/prepilin-type processing-associated H-X9-DG protein